MRRPPKHTPRKSKNLFKHMKNNSFELVAGKKHLVFKSQLNGSKIVMGHTPKHGHYTRTINKLIVQYHGTVDNSAANGKFL